MLFAFARRAFGSPRIAALAGVLYSFQYYGCDFWTTAQTDGWLNLPLALAALLVLRGLREEKSRLRLWMGAGACIGVAAGFKYTVILAGPLLAALVALKGAKSLGQRLKSAAWLLTGTALVMLGLGLALAAMGAMPAFLESQLGLVPAYARKAAVPGNPLVGFFNPLLQDPQLLPILILGLLGGLVIAAMLVLRPEHRLTLSLLLTWGTVAVTSTLAQRKFFPYQYLPILPLTSLFGAAAWLAVPPAYRQARRLSLFLALGTMSLPLVKTNYPERFADLGAIVSGQRSLREHWDSPPYHMENDFSLRDDLALADYLMACTDARQSVFIWGFEPLVYFVARRPLVSRFAYNYPMIFRWRPERFRAELMASLRASPPESFVVQHKDRLPHVTLHRNDSHEKFLTFANLRSWVEEHYRLETRVGRFDVYRLNTQPSRI